MSKVLPQKREEIEAAFKNVFNSSEGSRVMNWLRVKYYDCKIKDENLMRQVGQRDVVLEIINMLKVRE